jgi:hypothetical protein
MSDDAAYDETGEMGDETAFYKQLQSDVEDERSLALLQEVCDTNEIWKGQCDEGQTGQRKLVWVNMR